MGRTTTILAAFSVGFGIYWLNGAGYLPAPLGQALMVVWVLVMRQVAMPAAIDKEVEEQLAREGTQAAEKAGGGAPPAATGTAAAGGGGKAGGKAGKAGKGQ